MRRQKQSSYFSSSASGALVVTAGLFTVAALFLIAAVSDLITNIRPAFDD